MTIERRLCRIVQAIASSPGKRDHAKIDLAATGIFSVRKLKELFPSAQKIDVPHIQRRKYRLWHVTDDGFLSLMSTEDFSTKDDVKVSQGEVGEKIEKLFHNEKKAVKATVLGVTGQELAVEAKEA